LRPVANTLDRSVTLPARAYTAPDVLEWEQRAFFDGSWVCAGRATDLASPTDQRAIRVGTQGVMLVRGEDGVLRGFFNACRHRGHELLPCDFPAVSARVIKCPYHAWTYGLNGELRDRELVGGRGGPRDETERQEHAYGHRRPPLVVGLPLSIAEAPRPSGSPPAAMREGGLAP